MYSTCCPAALLGIRPQAIWASAWYLYGPENARSNDDMLYTQTADA